jgi:hypothetical protein
LKTLNNYDISKFMGHRIHPLLVMALALTTLPARAHAPVTTERPTAAERLAPTRDDLARSAARLRAHVDAGEAVGAALTTLQRRWTTRTVSPEAPCAELETAWRLEQFGAALRDLTQAARVEARTMATLRGAATVAPLVSASERTDGDALLAREAALERALATAGAWQATYARPAMLGCPAALTATRDPIPATAPPVAPARARSDGATRTAILALGDGWACGGGGPTRAGDAVVVVEGTLACWAPTPDCACVPQAVVPGAVIGPPVDDALLR